MLLTLIRGTVAALLAGVSLWGVTQFRGSNLRSPRYTRHPETRLWSPFRFFADEEWTQEGLHYRRRLLRWWLIWAGLALLLAALLSQRH